MHHAVVRRSLWLARRRGRSLGWISRSGAIPFIGQPACTGATTGGSLRHALEQADLEVPEGALKAGGPLLLHHDF